MLDVLERLLRVCYVICIPDEDTSLILVALSCQHPIPWKRLQTCCLAHAISVPIIPRSLTVSLHWCKHNRIERCTRYEGFRRVFIPSDELHVNLADPSSYTLNPLSSSIFFNEAIS